MDASDHVLAADFLVSEIMTARLLRDPNNEDDSGALLDPMEREAAAAVRSDILFLKHDSSFLRQSRSSVSGSWTGLNISSHFAFLLVVVQQGWMTV